MQIRRRRSVLAALSTALLAAGLGTPIVAAVTAPPPDVYIEDAPFVRHQVVQLGLIQHDATGGAIVERRVSNDPTTSGGILVNGIATPELGPWTLTAGPPGPRTVYGQFHYASGAWSTVASATVTLDASVDSALYIDADPRAFYPGIPVPVDFHEIVRAPEDVFYGQAHVNNSAGNDSFNVQAGDWSVSFGLADGPITTGTYIALDPPSEDTVAPVFAAVLAPYSVGCDGHGPFTIHSIAFTDDGDLESVDADFSLTCLDAVVSGSIRYGTIGGIVALDQSLDHSQFGERVVGGPAVEDSVTFTNIGTASMTLGDAEVTGPQATDFDLAADHCSGETLSVGEDCEITYRFDPGARGLRQAFLTVPDETQSGRRSVYLQGDGLQPTALSLAATSVPQFGPAEATIEVTVTPDTTNGTTSAVPVVEFDGVQAFGPTDEGPTGSGGRTYAYTTVVTPGHHVVTSEFRVTDFFLGSTATPISFDVGTKTALTLTTTTDDGVALGETATLIAALDTGAAIPGGTLEIRDGVTDALLASAAVSGNDPTLTKTLTPGLGTHGYTATFIPPNPTVQAASATYDLTVVAGTRPETTMTSAPLFSASTTVTSPFSSPDGSATFQCRVDAANWYPCTSPASFFANPPDPHQISVRAVSTNGLADRTPATRTWVVDTVPPTITTPKVTILPTTSFANGKVPVRVSWVGADPGGSGVAAYYVDRQIDGGGWIRVADDTQATSLDQSLAPGHYYRYLVKVLDRFAHELTSGSSATLSLRRFDEASPVVKYTGTWATSRSASYVGGVAKASSKAGSTASIKATMKTVEWVSRIGPTRGKAKVAVDGVTVATVNLDATTASGPRIVWSKTWSSAGSHRVTITVAGTAGHPSVIVDGFIVAS